MANGAMTPGLGGDEDCIANVLEEVLASPMAAVIELAEDAVEAETSAGAAGGAETPLWGPFERCF